MFRHVVLMRWTAESTAAQQSDVRDALVTLPGLIPQIRKYVVGADAGVSEGNFDLAVVADFDNFDDYVVYRDNPDHQEMIRQLIRPILAERSAVQHRTEG
jgi:hypothetical protein